MHENRSECSPNLLAQLIQAPRGLRGLRFDRKMHHITKSVLTFRFGGRMRRCSCKTTKYLWRMNECNGNRVNEMQWEGKWSVRSRYNSVVRHEKAMGKLRREGRSQQPYVTGTLGQTDERSSKGAKSTCQRNATAAREQCEGIQIDYSNPGTFSFAGK